MAQSQVNSEAARWWRQPAASSTDYDDRSGSCGQAWSTSIDLPLDANVVCRDVVLGHTSMLLLHTSMRVATHLIVREAAFPHNEWLVPLQLIASTGPECVRLRNDSGNLWLMDPFRDISLLPMPGVIDRGQSGGTRHQVMSADLLAPSSPRAKRVERLVIPPGTALLQHRAPIVASDGVAGCLANVLIEPRTGRLTYLLLHAEQPAQRDFVVSASHIVRVEDRQIELSLTRAQVSGPGAVRVRRYPC